jgi:hypothetical protein
MKKVLITGATSSQGSIDAHNRTARFAGLLNSTLAYSSIDSTLNFCSMSTSTTDLENYDLVVAGISPVSSLSANKIYNVLNVIAQMKDTGRLKILLDAPEPHLVYQSLKSILVKPELLIKDLYSSREGYGLVSTDKNKFNELMSAVEFLLDGNYDIITPSIPYYNFSREEYGVPTGGNTFSYNFDSIFLDNLHYDKTAVAKYWLAENVKTKWAKSMGLTVSKPVLSVKRNAYETKYDYIYRMQNSYGFMLNTYKNGLPWWSANLMLALSCGVPVFSDWRHTGELGDCWSSLPYTVESMSAEERLILAQEQLKTYSEKLNSLDTVAKQVATQLL